MKRIRALVFSEVYRNGEQGVGSRRIGSKEINFELYGEEFKEIEGSIYYKEGINHFGSMISVEAFEISSNQLVEAREVSAATQ